MREEGQTVLIPTSADQKEAFYRLLCEFFVENNVPFAAADSRTIKRLFGAVRSTYNPACGKTVSGTLLTVLSAKAEEHTW